ncbi:hypothetical protein PARU111607_02840 [Palleronia rufa]
MRERGEKNGNSGGVAQGRYGGAAGLSEYRAL